MGILAVRADIDHRHADGLNRLHRQMIGQLPGRHIAGELVHVLGRGNPAIAQIGDIRVKFPGHDRIIVTLSGGRHRLFHGGQQDIAAGIAVADKVVRIIRRGKIDDNFGILVGTVFVDFIDNGHRHLAIIRAAFAQLANQDVENPVEFFPHFAAHLPVQLVIGQYIRLPGQRLERDMAQLAKFRVFAIEMSDRRLECFHGLGPAFRQHGGRFAVMGGPVEIQIHRIRRLHGILRLVVALMQTDRRQGNLAVGNIAQIRGQIDPAHHFGSQ